jgi:oligoendopeptidase F
MSALTIPQRPARKFLGEEFSLTTWEQLQPFYENLKNRVINSTADLRQWFLDKSELESYLSENFAWRYIRMTCDTASELYQQEFNDFLENFQPQLSAYGNELDKKALESPFLGELKDSGFAIALRSMKKAIEIFREENIPLQTQIQGEQAKYGATIGAMMVNIEGQEVTLQKASDYLQATDRSLREEVWQKIQTRRLEDKDALDQLLNSLRDLRHQVATNAGFDNFRDYMFAALGRFDYTPQDCFNFHESVAEAVVPMLNDMATERKQALQLEALRPWDFKVDPQNRPPLKPFSSGEELLEKTITCFTLLDPQLGDYLRVMKAMGHLDLESRKGKAPGGYNYPLEEIGVPFIFMNATSNLRDLVTLLHEGGHAVHNFVTRDLLLNSFKNPPAEVAELASMSMELLTMDYWNVFFEDEEELRRAKIQHLESIIETLPWVATIDKFQHWLYENPTHSIEERQNNWLKIYEQFSDSVTDWGGLDDAKKYIWQKQLHIYEVPFYYIEYGMAQLGAVGVWRNYKQNPEKGLTGYLNALKLGYTAPISEIYAAANIPFDFSKGYITELMNFVKNELEELKK